MKWYIEVMKKYAVFEGRAHREEYWMFFLINFLIAFAIGFVSGMLGTGSTLSTIYSLAVLVPGIAVGIRRMHDSGRSGWWIICPIANFVFLCFDSQAGENEYGPNPKDA